MHMEGGSKKLHNDDVELNFLHWGVIKYYVSVHHTVFYKSSKIKEMP